MQKRRNNYQMKRGQAFETIMMVIAVIVALAILGFLTGILGNLGNIFNPSNPEQTMMNTLQTAVSSGYSSGTRPQLLTFSQSDVGTHIDTHGLTLNTPISPNDVFFVCAPSIQSGTFHVDSINSGTSSAVERLEIKQKVSVEMVICGNSAQPVGQSTQPVYIIALAGNGDTTGASNTCYSILTSNSLSLPIPSGCS